MSNTGVFASLALEDLEFKIAWRKDDSQIREDALRVWRRMKAITPSQEDERLNSLCVVAYDGEDLVGVSTVGITVYAPVRAKVAWFRCLVLPAYRKKGVATEFAVRCKDVLEEWSKNKPEAKFRIQARDKGYLFLALYSELARSAEGGDSGENNMYRVYPKFHMFQELAEFQTASSGDPSRFWAYTDESFVGLLGQMAFSRGGSSALDHSKIMQTSCGATWGHIMIGPPGGNKRQGEL